MEFKADALVLRTADAGENDKMVTLLTAERGKIGAALKGVKKAGAKLKFAAQPFCFAEFVFAERGGRYTVTGAALHDGFYGIRERVESFYAAAAVTEACAILSYEGMESGTLLVAAVEALAAIEGGSERRGLVRFFARACAAAGYPVTAGRCPVCGREMSGRRHFDMESGAFCCASCAAGAPASEQTYDAIRAADGVGEGTDDGNLRALRLLKAYASRKTETDFPALGAYLAL